MALTAGTFANQIQEKREYRRPIRVLILTKRNNEYSTSEVNFKSGLNNTASFLAEELHHNLHIDTYFTTCVDANSIDKEIHLYHPTHVVLEALWVTPDKLREIQNLHRGVIFTVRVHSKITFLAYEGNAIAWLRAYEDIPNVYVSFNSFETYKDFKVIMNERVLAWLPNIYKRVDEEKINFLQTILNIFKHKHRREDFIFNVACFGAIRPMKDILLQAVAAMKYCEQESLKLRFHINSGRVEQRGDSTLKNLRALFQNTRHKLVEHDWLSHSQFIELVKEIDLGMQVSLNESFNVVTADYVYNFKPIVVSHEIHWVTEECKTENEVDAITNTIRQVINNKELLKVNLQLLHNYNITSIKEWQRFLIETEL